jgi:hypothetical protein
MMKPHGEPYVPISCLRASIALNTLYPEKQNVAESSAIFESASPMQERTNRRFRSCKTARRYFEESPVFEGPQMTPTCSRKARPKWHHGHTPYHVSGALPKPRPSPKSGPKNISM